MSSPGALPDDAASSALLTTATAFVFIRRALHAYGVIIVNVEPTPTGGVMWTLVEDVAGRTRKRTFASGPGGHGYWERRTAPDGSKTWILIREEFYLRWRHPVFSWYAVEKAVIDEMRQRWMM
jgi:hypothetical protein